MPLLLIKWKIRCILIDDEVARLTYLKCFVNRLPDLELSKTSLDPCRLLGESDTNLILMYYRYAWNDWFAKW